MTTTNKFAQVHNCVVCQVEKGFGSCANCLFTRKLRQYQDNLKLRRDAQGKQQVVPASEADDGTPFVRLFRKVGRNEPCPCGCTRPDGRPKKFKHCCGVGPDLAPVEPPVDDAATFNKLMGEATQQIFEATRPSAIDAQVGEFLASISPPDEQEKMDAHNHSDQPGSSGSGDQALPPVSMGDVCSVDSPDHVHRNAGS